MSDRANVRRVWPALISALLVGVTALILSPSAAATWGSNEPCVGANGMSLKQQYGYSVAIVTPECTQVNVGERWAPSVPWVVNSSFQQVPSGFASDYSTPADDLRGKLDSIDVVVDPGSGYQTNRSYPGDNKIWAGQHPSAPGLPAFNTSNLGSLDPLPLGQHSVAVYWNLSAPHCDGFTADQGSSCLPAGKTLVKQLSFKVVDPYAGSPGQS
jgi:hypothetical protein